MATTVYIQPGTGSGSGTLASPYFYSELATAETVAGSGGTILFTDGTYNNAGNFDASGVIYQSLNYKEAVVTGAQLTIGSSGGNSVTVKNFKITTADRTDVFGSATIVQNCHFEYDNINYGVWFRAAIADFSNNVYINNLTSSANFIGSPGNAAIFSGNTVFIKGINGRPTASVGNNAPDFSGSNTIKNNIFSSDDTANNVISESISTHTNNCCFHQFGSSNTSGGTNNKFEDPLFVDSTNGDYRLRPTSPCINAGTAS